MVCIRTIQELVDAASSMMATESKKVEYPYLLFGGGDDPLCDPTKWRLFHQHTQSEDKELVTFDGLFHECLNETEPQQKRVSAKVIQWLEARCSVNNGYDKVVDDEDEDDDDGHPFHD